MARTIHTIEAVASSASMEVDRDEGIIRGVKILGLVSDNNRKYLPEAVRKAKSLYEGIKVNINHPAESGDVRNAEDRFGKLINVKYVEGEGLYGDLMFLKSHPMAERICEAAERNDMNDTFGLSHNAQGDGQEDDQGCFVVSSIVEVRHVDLVADPATTKSLREARMKVKEANSSDTFVCKIYKDFGGPYGKTGPKTIKEQSVAGSKEKAIAWVKSQLKSTPIKDDEQGKDYTIFGVVLRKGSGAIVAKYEKSETGSSIITHAESKGASMKAKESKQKPYASLYKGMWTVQDSNGKDIYSIPNKQYAIKFLNDNWDKLSSGTMQPHSSVKTKEADMPDDENEIMTEAGGGASELSALKRLMPIIDKAMNDLEQFEKQMQGSGGNIKIGNATSRKLQVAGEKLWDARSLINEIRNLEESASINDEDEMMTEAEDMPVEDEEMTEASGGILGPIMKEVTSNVSKAQEALKAAKVKGATIRHHIKGPLGAKITGELTKVLSDATGALDTLVMRIHSMETDPTWAGEGIESDDEEEMMTEAEDMPDEDPSEEEMTEAEDMPVEDPSEEEMTEGDGSSGDGSSYVIQQWEDGKFNKQGGPEYPTRAAAQAVADKGKAKLHPSLRDGGVEYRVVKIDRRGKVIKESDDVPVDETEDELAIEAEGCYTEEEYSDDEEKMAMEGSSDNVGKTSSEWDAHFEKQSKRMQDAINVGLMRGKSYPDAVKQAKFMVKEAIDNNEEDRMPMESKRRRLNTFCRNNGVTLTEGLYKDLRLLPEIAQRRCILRIKLAAKARKPKSSGSMMPMTESKVHTGDNVFNWLRS